MPNQVAVTANSVWSSILAGFTSFMNFVPVLIGALLVLAIGWVISNIVARLVEKFFYAIKLERAMVRAGLHTYLPERRAQNLPPLTASYILAQLAKWFIRLIFIQAAANILSMPQVTAIINNILLFIPNVLVAALILILGSMLARYVGELVEASVARTAAGRPAVFGMITRYAILGFAIIAAINQIGVATNLINILFTGLVASLAIALGLAFGLGGQGVASEITRSWYDSSRSSTDKLRAVRGGRSPESDAP